jgi:hypothetical protein
MTDVHHITLASEYSRNLKWHLTVVLRYVLQFVAVQFVNRLPSET